MTLQLALWERSEPVTVHCIFQCRHSGRMVVSPDPNHAHALMEVHYATYHQHEIDRIVGEVGGER